MSYDFEPAPPYKPCPPQRGPHYQAVVDNALRWLADNQPTPDGIRSVLHDYPALCKILYRDGRDLVGFNDAHKILTEVAAGRLNPAAVKEAADRERERADLRTIAERIKADAAPAADLLPGWRLNKLTLKACPNGKRPGVFAYGRVVYTVPGGDAWEAVCRLIHAGAFDGHGLPMKTPGDLFRREHRAFFNERMGRNGSGWFLRTL